MVSRRKFLGTLLASGTLSGSTPVREVFAGEPSPEYNAPDALISSESQRKSVGIDRAALVKRHNPTMRKLDPLSPLSLGNGEFAFTGDITGLQTFPREYENAMPLCTMSQWGWHTTPRPRELEGKSLRLVEYDTHGRCGRLPDQLRRTGGAFHVAAREPAPAPPRTAWPATTEKRPRRSAD